jgi:phospholipid transport system substrate-binding protein
MLSMPDVPSGRGDPSPGTRVYPTSCADSHTKEQPAGRPARAGDGSIGLKSLARFLALAVFGAALCAAGTARADSATETIQKLNDALMDVMKNASSLGFQGRADKLRPVLTQVYDLQAMGRTAVGQAWNSATPEQQKELYTLFERLTVDNYAARFKGYSEGEKFEIKGERDSPQGKIVDTEIVPQGKPPVSIDYVMRQRGDSYRVVDVLLEGSISEVATRRSEFTSVLAHGGFEALLAELREATKRLEDEGSH